MESPTSRSHQTTLAVKAEMGALRPPPTNPAQHNAQVNSGVQVLVVHSKTRISESIAASLDLSLVSRIYCSFFFFFHGLFCDAGDYLTRLLHFERVAQRLIFSVAMEYNRKGTSIRLKIWLFNSHP